MRAAGALVLAPDRRTQRELNQVLRSVLLAPIISSSLADALARGAERSVAVVIADLNELSRGNFARTDVRALSPSKTDAALRAAISRLRDTQRVGQHRIPVIVTAPRENIAAHAAALAAGADLFLSLAEATNKTILGAYLRGLLSEDSGMGTGASCSTAYARSSKTAGAEVRRVAEVFQLPTTRFRSDVGRLDAGRIAEAANIPLRQLATAIGVKYGTLHKTPDGASVQSALAPFANVLAMLYDVYSGDASLARQWLETPQAELGGRTPRAAMLSPGGAGGVEQFVTNAWLGAPA